MESHNQSQLYPKFYKEFSCIGPDCEHDCCHSWRIAIDRKTFHSYKDSRDPRLHRLTKDIMDCPPQPTDNDYRLIRLTEQGRCPLHNEDGTCYIHGQHGETLLPATCKFYPRIVKSLLGKKEPSLTLSCPEAARRILLDPSAMMFSLGDSLPSHLPFQKLTSLPDSFDLIRQTAFNTVLTGLRTPDERLFHLGSFFSMIANSQEQKLDVQMACHEFNSRLENGSLSETYQNQEKDYHALALSLRIILTEITAFQHNKVLTQYHNQLVQSLFGTQAHQQTVDLQQVLREKSKVLPAFLESCGHGLLNMMLHWIYSSDICTKTGKELLNGYAEFVLKYIVIRFYVIFLADKYSHEELLVGITHSFSRSSDHNSQFLKTIFESLIKENRGSHLQIKNLLKH